jgi:hypothetical protein
MAAMGSEAVANNIAKTQRVKWFLLISIPLQSVFVAFLRHSSAISEGGSAIATIDRRR